MHRTALVGPHKPSEEKKSDEVLDRSGPKWMGGGEKVGFKKGKRREEV